MFAVLLDFWDPNDFWKVQVTEVHDKDISF